MSIGDDVSDEEGLRLITAFLAIANPRKRQSIIEAAEAAAIASPQVVDPRSETSKKTTQDN